MENKDNSKKWELTEKGIKDTLSILKDIENDKENDLKTRSDKDNVIRETLFDMLSFTISANIVAKYIAEYNGNPNLLIEKDNEGNSNTRLLHFACERINITLISVLLSNGALINEKRKYNDNS